MRPNLPFLLAASNAIRKPGGLLKWKKRLVIDVKLSLQLTEVMMIARLTSLLPDVLRLASPRPRIRRGRRLAMLSRQYLTLNLCTLSFSLSLAVLPHLSLLLTSPTVPLPGNRLRSSSITWDPTFLSPSQRLCVTEPETTFLCSAKPRALRSLTCAFVPPLLPAEFLRLPLKPFLVHCHYPRQSHQPNAKAPSSLRHWFSCLLLQSLLVFTFFYFYFLVFTFIYLVFTFFIMEDIFHYFHL